MDLIDRDNARYLIFDVEATGLNTSRDRIIEICIQTGIGDAAKISSRRIKPDIPISAEAIEVHGINNEDLLDCPTFREVGESILKQFLSCNVIIGYNVSFDLQMLQAELKRNSFDTVPLHDKHIIDPFRIWNHMRPRRLLDAYSTFCDGELINAHSAEADVLATAEVYTNMLSAFQLEDKSLAEIASISTPADWIGINGQLRWKNSIPVFSFGKGKGKPVWEFLKGEPNYLKWMKGASFPAHVLEVCEAAAGMERESFLTWVRERYPGSRT